MVSFCLFVFFYAWFVNVYLSATLRTHSISLSSDWLCLLAARQTSLWLAQSFSRISFIHVSQCAVSSASGWREQFSVTMNEGHQRWRSIVLKSILTFRGTRISCISLGRNNDVRTMETVILHVISFPGDRKLLLSQSSDHQVSSDVSWSHPSSTKQEQTAETPTSEQLDENTDRFKRVSVLIEVNSKIFLLDVLWWYCG